MTLDPRVKAVVFDMDRTLLDTVVNFKKLTQIVGEEYVAGGVPREVLEEDLRIISTMNSSAWLARNRTPEEVAAITRRIEERSQAVEFENISLAKPFPLARELVEKLNSDGIKVAILTRGSKMYVRRSMEITGMDDLFTTVVDREDTPVEERKPHPAAMRLVANRLGVTCGDILYIGDEPVDYATAKAAGTMFVGVESGYLDRAGWEKLAGRDVVTYPSITEFAKELLRCPD